MRCEKPMKSRFADIDNAIKIYIANEISMEKNKELEELVFFSSYTIKFDVFKKATQKLKKILRQKLPYEWHVWNEDAIHIIEKYQLDVAYGSERYTYLLKSLLKAQIKINEAVMGHLLVYVKEHTHLNISKVEQSKFIDYFLMMSRKRLWLKLHHYFRDLA